ncbi:MAG: hypothetical protein NDI94_05770 [Candidatus Woesearchaeota archaeon]|nr:hypothetical protein [Candidatus Woesearchaeota archaeon]
MTLWDRVKKAWNKSCANHQVSPKVRQSIDSIVGTIVSVGAVATAAVTSYVAGAMIPFGLAAVTLGLYAGNEGFRTNVNHTIGHVLRGAVATSVSAARTVVGLGQDILEGSAYLARGIVEYSALTVYHGAGALVSLSTQGTGVNATRPSSYGENARALWNDRYLPEIKHVSSRALDRLYHDNDNSSYASRHLDQLHDYNDRFHDKPEGFLNTLINYGTNIIYNIGNTLASLVYSPRRPAGFITPYNLAFEKPAVKLI